MLEHGVELSMRASSRVSVSVAQRASMAASMASITDSSDSSMFLNERAVSPWIACARSHSGDRESSVAGTRPRSARAREHVLRASVILPADSETGAVVGAAVHSRSGSAAAGGRGTATAGGG